MQPNLLSNVPLQKLKQAIAIREKIESLENELSRIIGCSNISVWFHTTAKGINEIKKVQPGRFAWAS